VRESEREVMESMTGIKDSRAESVCSCVGGWLWVCMHVCVCVIVCACVIVCSSACGCVCVFVFVCVKFGGVDDRHQGFTCRECVFMRG